MHSGMYSALSGNLAAMKRLDVIASNLANAATHGFKQDRLAFDSVLAGKLDPPAVPPGQTADPVLLSERMLTDFSQGSMAQTGNPLDLAISGDGFFAVRTPDGVAYTRQGSFKLTSDGMLVTASGYPVLSGAGNPSEGQPVMIPMATEAGDTRPVINQQGTVYMNGDPVGTIGLYDFDQPYHLQKAAGAMFIPQEGTLPRMAGNLTSISQGALEHSNVNTVAEMVSMVETSRFFESCQRVVRNFDDMAAKAVNELARA